MSPEPWIIEELEKLKRPEQRPQPQLPIPMPTEPPTPKKDAPVERVVVIEL